MSTRSAIIRKVSATQYEGVYCHFDGYLEGVGQMLLDHYQDAKKVKKLIALGDLSILAENIAPAKGVKHSFGARAEGVTVAYHRDRNEKYHIAKGISVDEVQQKIGHNGYVYVYENGEWWRWLDDGRMIPLRNALAHERVEEGL